MGNRGAKGPRKPTVPVPPVEPHIPFMGGSRCGWRSDLSLANHEQFLRFRIEDVKTHGNDPLTEIRNIDIDVKRNVRRGTLEIDNNVMISDFGLSTISIQSKVNDWVNKTTSLRRGATEGPRENLRIIKFTLRKKLIKLVEMDDGAQYHTIEQHYFGNKPSGCVSRHRNGVRRRENSWFVLYDKGEETPTCVRISMRRIEPAKGKADKGKAAKGKAADTTSAGQPRRSQTSTPKGTTSDQQVTVTVPGGKTTNKSLTLEERLKAQGAYPLDEYEGITKLPNDTQEVLILDPKDSTDPTTPAK